MALIRADRVKESSTSTGTGAFTLAGADSTYRTFASVCAVADTVYYAIAHRTSNEWEVGLGTYSATNTLTRTTVHASSNANAAVSFSAGTKDVMLALTKAQLETYASLAGTETLTNKTISGASNTITNVSLSTGVTGTLPLANGGTGATTGTAAAANLVNSAPNDGQEYTLKSKKTNGAVSYYWVDSTGYAPTLDLLFAADKSLTAYKGPTPTFSRASTGTFFNSSGVLTSAAIGTPRFNHTYNGTSWVSRGLLVEEQRTNLNLRSEEFDNAAYSKNQCAVVANQVAAPDGATTADKLTATSGTVNPYAYQAVATANGSVYTFSIYVKKNTHDFVQIVLNGVANGFANFDINNGVLGTLGAGGSAASSIVNVGNGWYRCVVTYTTSSTSGNGFINLIGSATAGRGATFAAAGTESVYLWGQQLELGSFPTSYIPTTSASATRSADVCQITGSDFSGFWNGAEGSFAVEYDRLAAVDSNFSSGYPRIVTAVKTSDTSRAVTLFASESPSGEAFFVQDGTVQAWFSAGSLASANVSTKLSTGYKANDFAASLNGAAVATDASGTIPSGIDRMDIGNEYGVTRFHNGHIARLRYYPVRLPNATLQVLST